MKQVKLLSSLIIASALLLSGCGIDVRINQTAGGNVSPAVRTSAGDAREKDIVIVFTNDVHCGVDGDIGYSGLAAYRNEMEREGNHVLLIDDGDEIQGGVMGTLTTGEAIVQMMNDVGYDIAIPGNHEFDYGMDRYLELTKQMDFPVICCNFIDLRTGKPVFDPYIIKEIGGKRIAFVGVTTPTTVTSSTPAYFQDESGKFIYDFCQDEDGSKLCETVQNAVNAARSEGVDHTILISHLGINEDDSPYMSTEVIAHTNGIDAVLDGHSHSVVEMDIVKNMDGDDVILSQTGYKLANIGKLTIDPDGNMKTELINDYTGKDNDVTGEIQEAEASFEEKLSRVTGKTAFDMMATQDDGETWRVRNSETNMGDFVADAYQYATGADAAIVNGGGVRANIKAGDITYEDLININPFSNSLCIRNVTGQELADALEYSVRDVPNDFGGFLQVSGITFDVDLSVRSQVKTDKDDMFAGFDGKERRVSNIRINGKDVEPDREYKIASIEYILFNQGNGYTMFNGDRVDVGRYIEDIDALIEYMEYLGGEVPGEYSDVAGQGRISFKNQ